MALGQGERKWSIIWVFYLVGPGRSVEQALLGLTPRPAGGVTPAFRSVRTVLISDVISFTKSRFPQTELRGITFGRSKEPVIFRQYVSSYLVGAPAVFYHRCQNHMVFAPVSQTNASQNILPKNWISSHR